MCRLAAYIGPRLPAVTVVFGGTHPLYEQSWRPRELRTGRVNADGYGIVWYHEGAAVRLAEPRPIWQDEATLRQTLPALASTCVIAALRNATPDIPVDRSGLLPMIHQQWTFVLNGFVPSFRSAHMRALRARLPDDLYSALEGVSDSETLFLLAIAALRDGVSLQEALAWVARSVAERVGREEAQLNMLLSDGKALALARTSTVLETNSLYYAQGHPLAPNGTLVASEALDRDSSWQPVDGHTTVTFAIDGSVSSELLSP